MQRRAVGSSGLAVSRLGLGTLTWGRETRLEDARPLLRAFVAAGGSLVDTAAAYAAGDAERMLGRMLRAGDVGREDLILATKARLRYPGRPARGRQPRGRACCPTCAARCAGSAPSTWTCGSCTPGARRRWRSRWPRSTPAVAAGDVRYAGVCNFVGWQTAQAATWQAAFPGRTPITSAQVEYSLLGPSRGGGSDPRDQGVRDGSVPLVAPWAAAC